MNTIRYTIRDEIQKGIRTQGAEIALDDIGRQLGEGFGRVVAGDVGKKVFLKSYGFAMENNEQRDARKGDAVSSKNGQPISRKALYADLVTFNAAVDARVRGLEDLGLLHEADVQKLEKAKQHLRLAAKALADAVNKPEAAK